MTQLQVMTVKTEEGVSKLKRFKKCGKWFWLVIK